MAQFVPFDGDPVTTPDQILWATYKALYQYGYAGLSIQRIADFTDINKSSIYYHYENKDELLLAFLERVLEDIQEGFKVESKMDPVADLRQFIDQIFASTDADPQETTLPLGAYVEIRAQAVSNAAYRERIVDIDAALKEQLQSILQAGIDQGVMQDLAVEQVSEYILTTIAGAIERYATTDAIAVDAVRAELNEYLEQRIIV